MNISEVQRRCALCGGRDESGEVLFGNVQEEYSESAFGVCALTIKEAEARGT